MSSIPATLDLAEALQAFRHSVLPALEVGAVHAWDGRQLLQRESQIMQVALVLAGQCVVFGGVPCGAN